MTRRFFVTALLAIFAVGLFMRVAWLRSDPPTIDAVGIVWHDEGAWVHNARNRALWGTWRTDAWNPVFIAPVFTALEYGSFTAFGVGTWQARVVPVASGLLAIAALVAGLVVVADRRAAIIGGALLATNYAFVMWNRAALMESTMTAFIVVAWAAYALSDRRPVMASLAGIAAVAAWFTKASAAFFVAALILDAAMAIGQRWRSRAQPATRDTRAAWWALLGLTVAFLVVGALFVAPHWTDYQFYNWQMTVTRKPSYSPHDLMNRASWLPLVQGIFSRMWFVLALGSLGIFGIARRWTAARPAERVLVFWVFIGLAELIVHDSGNERRYVMFIPVFTALASIVVSRALAGSDGTRRVLPPVITAALVLPLAYLVIGSVIRTLLVQQIEAGNLKLAVRMSAALAIVAAATAAWLASNARRRIQTISVSLRPIVVACCLLALCWNVFEYARWTTRRTTVNADASMALGHLLAPGTIVQGKLANGMSLENQIRPIFVGNGFGNYDDRLRRDDARYILTYDLPRIGYESSDGSGLIQGILDHYPRRRVIATFVVDETPGPDRAVLIDKEPDGLPAHARD